MSFTKNEFDDDNQNGGNNAEDGAENTIENQKVAEYVKALLAEKLAIDKDKFPIAYKFIGEEITTVQSNGRIPQREKKYVDVYKDKPTKVAVKVKVPVRENPKFNFVGKLLGPKGSTLKSLQEETMCKLSILGRNSMRDKEKEEELRNSLDPKYSHLTDDLHVEISALGPPAEAYARMSYALAEIRKYLMPEYNDEISFGQMRQMEQYGGGGGGGGGGRDFQRRPAPTGGPRGGGGPRQGGPGQGPMRSAPRGSGPPPRGGGNVMSILDRARASMEDSYDYDEDAGDDGYGPEAGGGYGGGAAGGYAGRGGGGYEARGSAGGGYSSGYGGNNYGGNDFYGKSNSGFGGGSAPSRGGWKSSPPVSSFNKGASGPSAGFRQGYRATPYSRPSQ